MREITVRATAELPCRAPREEILAWERDPFAVASVDSRTRVTGYVATEAPVGSRWTMVVTVAGFVKVREQQLLMSLDPVVVESRRPRQIGTSTVTVSAVPDDDGRSVVTYDYSLVLNLPPFSHWYYSGRIDRLQGKLERTLRDYAGKSIAAIESRAGAGAGAGAVEEASGRE